MPTIKLSGGKVILKGGKASCSCCDAACCLYPWPDSSGAPLYPATDLPNNVRIVGPGVDFTAANNGDYSFGVISSPSPGEAGVYAGGFEWIIIGFGEAYLSQCLIGSSQETDLIYIEDQFPDSLAVNGTDAIIRDPETNLCTWSGSPWTLRYNSTTYKFQLNGVDKDDPQDSPVGTYGANTVS